MIDDGEKENAYFTFSITPNKYGSSLAAFKLKYVGDFTGKVRVWSVKDPKQPVGELTTNPE